MSPETSPETGPEISPAVIGRRTPRVEGVAKVTGAAHYAADADVENAAYAVMVPSAVARGRVATIDTGAAAAAPGVLAVLTHETMPRLNPFDDTVMYLKRYLPLQDGQIRHAGQPVALVVADGLERARHAANLVRVRYVERPARVVLADGLDGAYVPPPGINGEYEYVRGEPDAALAASDVRVDLTCTTPLTQGNPMEPPATVAVWSGDEVTLYESTQGVANSQNAVAQALGLPLGNVRILTPHIGGGFGVKGPVWPHTLLAAAAAREVGRPVKLVLTRADTYTANGHRAETHQRIRLGATRDGRLTAIDHVISEQVSSTEEDIYNSPAPSRVLYACANVRTAQRAVRLDLPTGTWVRSPESVVGHALESAIDELSYRVGVDPLELRLRNWTDRDQERDVPYGSNHLRECYERGAEIFGWSRRPARPGTTSGPDGDLVGWGMAAASHVTGGLPGSASSVTVRPDGTADIRCGTVDMGTGTYTVMSQIGAETLGLPLRAVRFDLGDSRHPEAIISSVSTTVPSSGASVARSCARARDQIIALAVAQEGGPLYGRSPDEISVGDGYLYVTDEPRRRVRHRTVLLRHGRPVTATTEPVDAPQGYSVGSTFAEVSVSPRTGQVRVTRLAGVFDPGRVLNPQTARSQAIGGAIWGIGIALTEHTLVDQHLGRIVTPNLSGYLVPVNADVPHIDVEFIDRPDPAFPPLGARGFGETPSTGFSAAIGNAVHHAIGHRILDLPITQDKVLAALAAASDQPASDQPASDQEASRAG